MARVALRKLIQDRGHVGVEGDEAGGREAPWDALAPTKR